MIFHHLCRLTNCKYHAQHEMYLPLRCVLFSNRLTYCNFHVSHIYKTDTVIAKKKLLAIRICLNKKHNFAYSIYPFFSLLQGSLFRLKKRNRYTHDTTEILSKHHATNMHENCGNVCFIKRNYEILYKEKFQSHDTFWHACTLHATKCM